MPLKSSKSKNHRMLIACRKGSGMIKVPVLYSKKEECCGCTACYAVCPKDAITMVQDEEGFEYPVVNEKKCVFCYQCLRVCPIKHNRN